MNYPGKWILSLFMICAAMSCQKTDQQQLQEQYLENKVDDYKNYKWRSCMQEIEEEAEARSDSFFIAMAKKQTFDSTKAPKPIARPNKPESKIREDSLPLKPLLGNRPDSTLE